MKNESPEPRIDFDRYVPFFLSALGNRLSRSASRTYLRQFGVGVNEWRLLANLRVRDGATAGEICHESGIDKAAASRAVAALEKLGCITTGREARDARARSLTLTVAGITLHDRILAVALQREACLLAGFSEQERSMLVALLRRLYDNVGQLDGQSANIVDISTM